MASDDLTATESRGELPLEEKAPKVGKSKTSAAGATAVASSMNHVMRTAGPVRGTKALLELNQRDGFDCPSCAWPDPDDHRAQTEFCENGAKAIASEAVSYTHLTLPTILLV